MKLEVSLRELCNSSSAKLCGFGMSLPPILGGSSNTFLSKLTEFRSFDRQCFN